MQAHRIEPNAVTFERSRGRLRIAELDVSLAPRRHEFFLKGLKDALLLARRAKATFSVNASDEILIEIADVRAFVESYQDLLILKDIFVTGIYNITPQRPAVVIDIGMNVGYTSLFLALQPNVIALHGFEPFEPTFRQLQRNLDLNPGLRNRIHAYNLGLGDADTTLVLPYSYQKKGSMGVAPLKRGVASDGQLAQLPITIADAARIQEFTGPIDSAHDLVLKIDCEGAEYDILPALQAAGILTRASAVMLEWHVQGPDALVRILQQSDFTVISMADPDDVRFGMIYAMRRDAAPRNGGHEPR